MHATQNSTEARHPDAPGRTVSGKWVKGYAPNPAGRPGARFSRRVREATHDGRLLVKFAMAVLQADLEKLLPKGMRMSDLEMNLDPAERSRMLANCMPTLRERLFATKWLADRGHGKAPEGELDPTAEMTDQEVAQAICTEIVAKNSDLYELVRTEVLRQEKAKAESTAAVTP